MAAQNLIEQHIFFVVPPGGTVDEDSIFANSLVRSFASNCAGSDIVTEYKPYRNWNGSAWTVSTLFDIFGYIQPAFQATVQSNIAALQASFPQYTITTEGTSSTFGF